MAKGLAKLFKFGFGALDDLGMFSPTEKAIDMLPQQIGTPEQMFSQIGKIGGKGAKEEMLFTGIEDAFATAPKVTTKELKDYLSDNKTRINEIVKSDVNAKKAGQLNTFKDFFPFSIKNIMIDGTNRGERTVNDILDKLAIDDEPTKKLLDYISNDPARTGTLDNPYVNKIDESELSSEFSELIMDKQLGKTSPTIKAKDLYDKETKNLIKFRFTENLTGDSDFAYTIRGNKNVGFEVTYSKNTDKDFIDSKRIAFAPNYNEALVKLSDFRRKLIEKSVKGSPDLRPMHELYTLPGGKNYQELLLTMPEPIDDVADIAGKYDDVIQKDRFGAVLNLNAITGSPSDITLSPQMLKILDDGKILDIGIDRNVRLNKDTGNIEILKKDYRNQSHTKDEQNVIVFARTKDRVDEEGRKILYAEEIQSDMAQKGRKKGLVMGQKEKKAFINKNNPIIFGDILDSIEKLKETTNIADLKAIRTPTTDARDLEIGRIQPANQTIGFDNDDSVIVFDSYRQQTNKGKFTNAPTMENIIKKQMTKYKFHELKDKRTKDLTDQGFNKDNINLVNKNVLEDLGIVVPKGLYSDVSDFISMRVLKGKISSFRKSVGEKIYNREFDKTFGPLDKEGNPINRIDGQELIEFNNNILKKLLGNTHQKFMKDTFKEETAEALELFTKMNPTKYNKLKNDEKMDMTLSDIGALDIDTDTFRKFRQNGITKSEFEEFVIAPRIQSRINSRVKKLSEPKLMDKAKSKNFDYSDNAIDEVLDGLIQLDNNLDKAVKYEILQKPISDIPSAPFIGSSERFTELGIKRLLKYARDNDYDGVSFSTGRIHDKRWNEPNLTQYYDVVIPKVAKNILKGTDAKLEYKTIFTDADFKKDFDNKNLSLMEEFEPAYDINKILDENLGTPQIGGYITDTPTIYLTPDIKKYIDSGISLYSPIVATGLAGAITSQILGPEEDIIENEVANVGES